ncbi:MAG: TolC family protein [Chitinophagaceae bacterium]
MKLKIIIAILFCLNLINAKAQSDSSKLHAFSVQQCIDYATKNNMQVKNALLDLKIQLQTNRGITAAAYPQINGTISSTFFPNVTVQSFPNFIAAATYGVLTQEGVKDGSGNPIKAPEDFGFIAAAFGTKWNATAGVTLSQILFDGQVFVGLQARKTSIDYQQKTIDLTAENVRANVYKIYYQLVVSKTQIDQLDANIARAEKLLNDTRELYKNGFAEKIDADRASVQLANLETEKQKAVTQIANGYLGLKFLIGMPEQDSLVLTDEINDDQIKQNLLNEGVYNYADRNDYQLLQLGKKLNEYNIKRYKYTYFPTVNLSAGYSKNAQRNQFNFFNKGDWFASSYIGLNINIPIFDGFARDASIQKAKLQLQQLNNQISNLQISIANDVMQATNNFHTAIGTLDFQKKNMELAEQVYNQSKKKYEAGTGSTTDITNAQTDLRVAQSNYINALYDAIIAKIDYMKAIGKL